MANPAIIELPQVTDGSTVGGAFYVVTVFNNDHNTYEEVIEILMRATACPRDEAELETWEIDNLGRSVVHYGDQSECETAAEVIRQIGIRVEVSAE
jgi:ATP-dependent Clp protease adapter protein ClpS